MEKNNKAERELPNNVLDLKPKDVNINIDGDVVSIALLEKIFFLTKISNDPAFVASTLSLDVKKVDRIIHNCEFQKVINEHFNEYFTNEVGESVQQLTLRYSDLLKECFTSLRISTGLKIRKAIEDGKPLDGSKLNVALIEKVMRLEFALHGLPIDIKGFLHGSKDKEAKDKSNDELLAGIKTMTNTIDRAIQGGFDPLKYIQDNSSSIEDGEIIEEQNNNKDKESQND
jgi:hypothetical protein